MIDWLQLRSPAGDVTWAMLMKSDIKIALLYYQKIITVFVKSYTNMLILTIP